MAGVACCAYGGGVMAVPVVYVVVSWLYQLPLEWRCVCTKLDLASRRALSDVQLLIHVWAATPDRIPHSAEREET